MEPEAYTMINIPSDFVGKIEEHLITSNLKIYTSHYCHQPVPSWSCHLQLLFSLPLSPLALSLLLWLPFSSHFLSSRVTVSLCSSSYICEREQLFLPLKSRLQWTPPLETLARLSLQRRQLYFSEEAQSHLLIVLPACIPLFKAFVPLLSGSVVSFLRGHSLRRSKQKTGEEQAIYLACWILGTLANQSGDRY